MNRDSFIYVAGHTGLVGSSILDKLRSAGYGNLLYRTHHELDLEDQGEVKRFFSRNEPEYVFLCAAKVGGIYANEMGQAEFLYHNMMIQNNVIWSALEFDVKKLLFFGSSCIYPQHCEQPMKEEYLLRGRPEPLNEGYALAKIAGLKLCEHIFKQYRRPFISLMLPNIYGPHDNFDPLYSHVISGLISRMHKAKVNGDPVFKVWGTGNVKREFIYSGDVADAAVFLMNNYESPEPINVGSGVEYTVKQVVELVKRAVQYCGVIEYDTSKPDGAERKLLDSSRMNTSGWAPCVTLEEGIRRAYEWAKSNVL